MTDREDDGEEALRDIDGADQAALAQALERADPNSTMAIHWLLNNIGPRDLAAKLAAVDAAVAPSGGRMAEYEARWRTTRDAAGILHEMLAAADRLTGFDCETRASPANHAELLQDLALISRPVLAIEAIAQTVEPDGRCELRFMLAGRGGAFRVESKGRAYDLRGVLKGLDNVLEGLGRSERFLQLYTGDRTALVLFARAAPFLAAARELRLPVMLDPDRARQLGLAETH